MLGDVGDVSSSTAVRDTVLVRGATEWAGSKIENANLSDSLKAAIKLSLRLKPITWHVQGEKSSASLSTGIGVDTDNNFWINVYEDTDKILFKVAKSEIFEFYQGGMRLKLPFDSTRTNVNNGEIWLQEDPAHTEDNPKPDHIWIQSGGNRINLSNLKVPEIPTPTLTNLKAPITWDIEATDTVGGSDEGANIGFDRSDDFYIKAPWTASKMIFKARGTDKISMNRFETVTQPILFQNTSPHSLENGHMWRDESDVYVRTGGQSLNLTDLHQGARPNRVRIYPVDIDTFNKDLLDGLIGRDLGSIGITNTNVFGDFRKKAFLVVRGKRRWFYLAAPTKAFDHSRTRRNKWESVPMKRIQLYKGSGGFDDDLDGTGDIEDIGGWSFGKIFIYENGTRHLIICNRTDDMEAAKNIVERGMASPSNIEDIENTTVTTDSVFIASIPIINISSLNASKLDSAFGDGVGCIGYNTADGRVYYSDDHSWWYA